MANKEVQLLTLEHSGNLETWEIVIRQFGQFDSGTFKIQLLKPGSSSKWTSDAISINTSDEQLKTELYKYFKTAWKTGINVESSGSESGSGDDLERTRKYRITLKEPISGASFEWYQIFYTETTATEHVEVSINTPNEVTLSDPPLNHNKGKY